MSARALPSLQCLTSLLLLRSDPGPLCVFEKNPSRALSYTNLKYPSLAHQTISKNPSSNFSFYERPLEVPALVILHWQIRISIVLLKIRLVLVAHETRRRGSLKLAVRPALRKWQRRWWSSLIWCRWGSVPTSASGDMAVPVDCLSLGHSAPSLERVMMRWEPEEYGYIRVVKAGDTKDEIGVFETEWTVENWNSDSNVESIARWSRVTW